MKNAVYFQGVKKPRTDNDTRWNSTFEMVKDFKENSEAYKEITHADFFLLDDTWDFIDEYFEAFQPVAKAMKYFQMTDLTMSEY